MDADVRLAPGALRDAVAFCEERELRHLALFPRFERVGFWEEVLLPLLGLTLFSFFPSFVALSGRLRRAAFGATAPSGACTWIAQRSSLTMAAAKLLQS